MRRALQTALSTVLAGAVLGLPAAADADTAVPVPSTGTITLSGHGYGHGHGMSQYGAQGAGRLGKTWNDIVGFYYPGTTQAKLARTVRVLISGDTTSDLVVSARSGLIVINTRDNTTATIPANGATRWKLGVSGTRTTVWYLKDGTWTYWRSFSGDGAFRAGGAPLSLWFDGAAHGYRGTLVAASPVAGGTARDTVNVLDLETYLRGVVPREMPASWSPAALGAQAVAARTYAAYLLQHPSHSWYDICDTTSCQVYGGFDAEAAGSDAAITATRGVILTYGGSPAFTQFGSSSGGFTSAGSVPYLVSQSDPWDDWSGNPVHDWTLTFDVRKIESAYPTLGNLTSVQVTSRYGPTSAQWGGRVRYIELRGTKNGTATKVTTPGDTFRSKLGLRSTYFAFSKATASPTPTPSPTP